MGDGRAGGRPCASRRRRGLKSRRRAGRPTSAGAAGRSGAFDLVVKVGGSLGRRPAALRDIVRRLAVMARRRRVLVVPGGGVFADLVRRERRRLGLEAEAAHRMALRATDLYGVLLASLHPRAAAAADLAAARRLAGRGHLAILLPAALVDAAPGLERTFRLTSDSIAAWVAGRTGARRLLLLKSVRGIAVSFSAGREAGGPGRRAGALPGEARQLTRRGVVDPLFPWVLPAGIAVQVMDARGAWTLSREAAGLRAGTPPGAGPRGRAGRAGRRGSRSGRRRRGPRARR